MKYSVQIVCAILGALPPVTVDAENDKSAVDQARVLPIPHAISDEKREDGSLGVLVTELDKTSPFHIAPLEGGDYTVEVRCLEACSALVWDPALNEFKQGTRPADALVSQYQVKHPPHEAVRDEVEKKRAELAEKSLLEEKRAALKAELTAEILAEQAAASGKTVQK
jgi:hypothetical protein